MSPIKIVNSNHQLGIHKLMQIFLLWFEENEISVYDEIKSEWKTDSEKKLNLEKKY